MFRPDCATRAKAEAGVAGISFVPVLSESLPLIAAATITPTVD